MTLDDVKKIAIARGDSVEQCLLDMLRASQAQTVQMREDAALTVEDCLRTGLLTPGNVKTAAAQVRRLPLPAPAARTYDDGVRDAARRVIEAVDACDREAERDPASQSSAPMVRYINAVSALRAALLSPAPAVAPVAEPVPRASGVTDKELIEGLVERVRTLEGQLPEYVKDDKIIYRECEKGHGRLLVTTWVDRGCPRCEIAAPKPGPTVCADCGAPAVHLDVKNRLHATPCCGSQRCCFFGCMGYATRPLDASDEKPVAFDAEAALVAMRWAFDTAHDQLEVTVADVRSAIDAGLAAGRKP